VESTAHYYPNYEDRHEGAFRIVHVVAVTHPFFGFAANLSFLVGFIAGGYECCSLSEVVYEISVSD
jgi:hypothetical protein